MMRGRFLAVALAIGVAFSVAAEARPSIVVDASSGRVLEAKDATQPWYPASLTKLMTAFVVFEAIRAGRLDLDTPIPVSERAARMAPSKMGYPPGTLVTVEDALKMLIVKSANDIAVALAEGTSGSVEAFVAEMNAASRQLGMTQSVWANPNGLPDDRQVTSARDMAILARAVLTRYPAYAPLFRIHAIQSGKRVMRTHNPLLYRYPGADGMKTGFICASGFNVVATATRDGRKLITVVLGSNTAQERSLIAARLFEKGFADRGFGAPTVESLPAAGGAPPNLRAEVCGKRRPPASLEDGETGGGPDLRNASLDRDLPLGAPMSEAERAAKRPLLLASWKLDPPIVVGPYTGDRKPNTPAETTQALAFAEAPAAGDTGTALLADLVDANPLARFDSELLSTPAPAVPVPLPPRRPAAP